MRCDTCGARNAEDASWCTQCYASFLPSAAEQQEASTAAPVAPAGDTPASLPSDGPPATPPADIDELIEFGLISGDGEAALGARGVAGDQDQAPMSATAQASVEVGDVREIDGTVQWRCRSCQQWSGLEETTCATCGAARVGFGESEAAEVDVRDLDERTILGATLVLPGLGHVLAGRMGSGITRIALWVMWLVGGLWWIFSTTTGRSPGLLLLSGAAVLWAATLWDIQAVLRRAAEEPFGVRGLLWLVVGVTGLLMLSVAVVATGSATG